VDKLIAGQFIHIGNELCRILLILESSGCFYASIHSVDEVGWKALFYRVVYPSVAFSALTLLVGSRKGIRPVKNSGGVLVCPERGAGLHMAQLMPLPLTVSCFSKIQVGFTFLYQLTG